MLNNMWNRLTAVFLLCCSAPVIAVDAKQPHFSFDRKPFVSPKIVEDLTTWESDTGEQVVAVNLSGSAHANRYFADVQVSKSKPPFVYYEDSEKCEDDVCRSNPPRFGYRLVGKTTSGIYILFTEWSGGGSGRFRELLLVTVEPDKGLANYAPGLHVLRLTRDRWVIKKLGYIPLGDRYEGSIAVKGNTLRIGKDDYSKSADFFQSDTELELDLR